MLAAVVWLFLLLGGCSTKAPAPVYGWNWTGPAPDGYYLVRSGDSLGLIAQRLGIGTRKLAKWNRLKSPYTIYADTLLRVEPPDGTGSTRIAKAPEPASPRVKKPARTKSSKRAVSSSKTSSGGGRR